MVLQEKLENPEGLNPLNQVYVFNDKEKLSVLAMRALEGLNPLNQVYVFNPTAHNIFYNKELQPHFRRGHLFLLQFRVFLL